jgi:hypothetical protein
MSTERHGVRTSVAAVSAQAGTGQISEGAVIERLRSEATTWINAVHLQVARLDSSSSDMEARLDQDEIDLHFLLVALVRLRRGINRCSQDVPRLRVHLEPLLDVFDATLPSLEKLRNVGEHADEYNVSRGRDPRVLRRQVQVGAMDRKDGLVWLWLGERFEVNVAHHAAATLFRGFCAAVDGHAVPAGPPPPGDRHSFRTRTIATYGSISFTK